MDLRELKSELENCQPVTVAKTDEVINPMLLGSLEIIANRCLQNSYRVAQKMDAICVEGLALHRVNGEIREVVFHCWNKIGTSHFDVTEEYAPLSRPELKEEKEQSTLSRFIMGEYKVKDYQEASKNRLAFDHLMRGVKSSPGQLSLQFLSGARSLADRLKELNKEQLTLLFDSKELDT
jgi:hypothetical protein